MDDDLPRDAKIVKSLLKSMSVEEYEPRVVHQFLELWYRYVVYVLTDAQIYSEHAGKAIIDCDDVKLAILSKVNFSFSQPPPRELLMIALFLLYAFAICGYIIGFCGCSYPFTSGEYVRSVTLIVQVLLELARNRNKIPLPKTVAGPGISLPPDEDTLISPNYQLVLPMKQSKAVEETEEDERSDNVLSEQRDDLSQSTEPRRVPSLLSIKPNNGFLL